MTEAQTTVTHEYRLTVGSATNFTGTVSMLITAGSRHVRQAEIRLPGFKKEPVVTATVQSNDSNGKLISLK